jgi:DNA (cytosine-5)-methyltransferase 1
MEKLKAVDFFCGAGGMSFGLQKAGIHIIGGIDNSPECEQTYKFNIPGAEFILHDITTLSPEELSFRLGIKTNDSKLIFAGCSPCQFWSKIRADKRKSAQTAFLLKHFQRFIDYFRPGFVVIENVPGLYKQKETPLSDFTEFLKTNGYVFDEGIINANHYGVPQNRKRYLLLASRVSEKILLPRPEKNSCLTVRSYLGEGNGFQKITAGHRDDSIFLHTASKLSPQNLQRIRLTPKSGGSRKSWKDDNELQISAYRGKDEIFRDVYGRMYWDKPAPTITTKFYSFSNGRFGHPEEDRAISIREGATLQTFPKDFVFYGDSLQTLGRQIGNAVPPNLAYKIGQHLMGIFSDG